MEYQDIRYEVDGPAAVITLNRAEKLNAWTTLMEREYRDALDQADANPDVRAVIVTGEGRGFCAGADMAMLGDIRDARGEGTVRDVEPEGGIEDNYRQAYSYVLASRKPLIAAINGPAAGLGLVITLYCDLRFASETARFGTAFASLGLVAEHGASWLLPRIVGTANALDLLYSARVIDAKEALAMGLVQRVYPAEELLLAAKEYVALLARRSSPHAMGAMKRLVYDAQFTDLAQAVRDANAAMKVTLASPDFAEGLAAFAEKRDPQWQGLGKD